MDKEFVTQSQFALLSNKVEENTILTKQIHTNTSGLVEAFQAASGALHTLEVLGRISKPLLYIGGACSFCWGLWVKFRGHFGF